MKRFFRRLKIGWAAFKHPNSVHAAIAINQAITEGVKKTATEIKYTDGRRVVVEYTLTATFDN